MDIDTRDPSMQADQPTGSPTPIQHVMLDSIPEVQIKGVPALWQMALALLTTAIFTVGAILGIGHLVLNKSLEAMEARLNNTITKSAVPVSEEVARLRGVVKSLISASTLTEAEKEAYRNFLDPGSAKSVLRNIHENSDKRSVQSLIKNKQIEQRAGFKFKWNDGKNDGQVRNFVLKDATLDLSKIDLYSEGDDDPCSSKVLELPDVSNAVVQLCEEHLSSEGKLEFIVIQSAE
jgi:hypothetical protein